MSNIGFIITRAVFIFFLSVYFVVFLGVAEAIEKTSSIKMGVENIGFFYKDHNGEVKKFKIWGHDDHPDKFYMKFVLNNNSKSAIKNTKIAIFIEYKIGIIRRHPTAGMTDYELLERSETVEWQPYEYRNNITIPSIAAQDSKVIFTEDFPFRSFYTSLADRELWPSKLRITIYIAPIVQGNAVLVEKKSTILRVIPLD